MAVHVLNAATIYIGNSSVDISDHVESVEVQTGIGNVAVTAMTNTWEQNLINKIKRWSVRLNCFQDYDASEIYSALSASLTTDTTFPIFVKATTAAVSATNPAFTGSVVYDGDFNVIGGAVGEAHKVSVSLKGAGTLSFLTSASA